MAGRAKLDAGWDAGGMRATVGPENGSVGQRPENAVGDGEGVAALVVAGALGELLAG